MANKDLFKQAIAEAKSVREAAIANAKEALEETLTPHLKDMLAAKLQEMEEKDMEEGQGNIDANTKNAADQLEEEMTYEEEEGEEELEGDSEKSEEGEQEHEEEEEVEVKDMEVEDLKNLIRDILSQEMGAQDSEQELSGDEMEADDMVGAEDDEEIDLDELLREINEMEKEGMGEGDCSSEKEMEEGYGDRADGAAAGLDTIKSALSSLIKKGGAAGKKASELLDTLASQAGSAMRNEGDYSNEEEMEEGYGDRADGAAAGLDTIKSGLKSLIKKGGEAGRKASELLDSLASQAGSAMRNEEEAPEFSEAMKTVKELKAQLQEVNLLNAKLLYVNKVFKVNNLTESQKVNVIAAFDKAETVREVKLVFETVADSVGKKPARQTIKESKLGMASKATGTTAKRPQVIAEANETVKRMQKLAGIIK